jgi:hypothetical protein
VPRSIAVTWIRQLPWVPLTVDAGAPARDRIAAKDPRRGSSVLVDGDA